MAGQGVLLGESVERAGEGLGVVCELGFSAVASSWPASGAVADMACERCPRRRLLLVIVRVVPPPDAAWEGARALAVAVETVALSATGSRAGGLEPDGGDARAGAAAAAGVPCCQRPRITPFGIRCMEADAGQQLCSRTREKASLLALLTRRTGNVLSI